MIFPCSIGNSSACGYALAEWPAVSRKVYCMEKREAARKSGAQRTRMRRRRQQNKASMVCITLIVLILTGITSVQIVTLYHKNQDYQEREAGLQAQVESEKQRQESLEEYERYVTTTEYIEQIAKSKLGLVYPNEIIFKEEESPGE